MNRHMLIVLPLFTGAYIFSSDILRRVEPCLDAARLGDGASGPVRPCDGVDLVSRLLAFLLCYLMVARCQIRLDSVRDEPERERVVALGLRGLTSFEDQMRFIGRGAQRRCSVASDERAEGAARPG